MSFRAELPKRIYAYWDQGAAAAPPLVQMNLWRWQALNPDWEMIVFDEDSLHTAIASKHVMQNVPTRQAMSDFLRVNLLAQFGGVWVDASLYPSRPLEDWLYDYVDRQPFFAFSQPAHDRLISSWFLASVAPCSLVSRWLEVCTEFWSQPRNLHEEPSRETGKMVLPCQPWSVIAADLAATFNSGKAPLQFPYFWFHYLFEHVVRTDETAKKVWAHCDRLPAEPCHTLQLSFKARPTIASPEITQILCTAPVHKLDWRMNLDNTQILELRTRYPTTTHMHSGT
ncbi:MULTISPECIES: capsular polysaccharide synthesis protein [unclassified Ruegeria]|uniref:capsular polysaccharide synthesis protein n=1 Tax=unclassified Ruegeria TaxID=2625375 RepID=UPI0014931517|nr:MULTISPECIES: capsular polysaccharide synthesis protein [unclassified Ruegeria]NOD47539.1 hypothetical protein [Ruegeria sp. HKCCD5849]NOD53068.1 hypothetical protein [Ruegeria sp. HKCCD5851]NOD66217.1 hypothetical protein [Ruegeria sp. HKCCD7303]